MRWVGDMSIRPPLSSLPYDSLNEWSNGRLIHVHYMITVTVISISFVNIIVSQSIGKKDYR
jgi:uncharacterized membrane protein (DUF4010 family)